MRCCSSPSHGRGGRRWIQIAHMCVSTPLCNAWAITHYIERKGARKACIRCLKRARRPSFLFPAAICMRGVSGCIEVWEGVGDKR